ncbi:MAG: hypothetical protein ACK5C3_04600, partial [bacterium]
LLLHASRGLASAVLLATSALGQTPAETPAAPAPTIALGSRETSGMERLSPTAGPVEGASAAVVGAGAAGVSAGVWPSALVASSTAEARPRLA